MYRVRFVIQRAGYRKQYLEGIYIPPSAPILYVAEMKRLCTEFIRARLEEQDPSFRDFTIECVLFKRLRIDFLCGSEKSRYNIWNPEK